MSSMGSVNGLLINSEYIDIISSNIANASTIGYKSRNPVFFDIFSHSFYSNTTKGCGVGLLNVVQNFNNGVLIETGRDLDLGISQGGFFRVLDTEGRIHYTRDGQFFIDKNHNIVNIQGMYLTGQNKCYSKDVFNNTSNLEPINLQDTRILKEKSTSTIKLKAILNRNSNSITHSEGPDNQLSATEDYTTHMSIYNKDGEKEQIIISFNKQDKNTWKVNVQSDNSNDEKDINNSFDLKFDENGELTSKKSFNIQSTNPKKYENITLDLTGTMEQSTPNNFFEEYSQDGYPQGVLQTFNIAPNGEIIGIYSNQEKQTIGQILLSKFINPEKLQPETGNVWSATAESGEEIIGIAGSDQGFGTVNQKMLEASNVDLNQELINMIIAQRNYQSNAQSFKAEDKIINTLINLR